MRDRCVPDLVESWLWIMVNLHLMCAYSTVVEIQMHFDMVGICT